MDRTYHKKKLLSRITAMLLIGCLIPLLLWGCSMGKNDSPRPKQTVDKESTTADTEGLNTEKETFSTSESELLDSMPKVIAYVEEMAQVGAEEFALVCFDEMLNGAYNNS